jgi:hypothetical protein
LSMQDQRILDQLLVDFAGCDDDQGAAGGQSKDSAP